MKTIVFALLCLLVCTACSRSLTTLSDGRPGYAVTCDTLRERCLAEIALSCRGRGYTISSERDQEVNLPYNWSSPGPFTPGSVLASHNSRYWMEAHCEGADVKAE